MKVYLAGSAGPGARVLSWANKMKNRLISFALLDKDELKVWRFKKGGKVGDLPPWAAASEEGLRVVPGTHLPEE